MSNRQHGFPWLSLTTRLDRLLLQVGLQVSWLGTVSLDIASSWSSCLCSSMWWGLEEYVAYEVVLTSPIVSHMSGSSNLGSFRDGW